MRSPDRVRDLGEVFTPPAVVNDMLDLLPAAMWEPHPSPTFLEPAAGDGNFLVAILERKLNSVSAARAAGTLPAGSDKAAVEFHGLEALASIYGVDISTENIAGGPDGDGARDRMLATFASWFKVEASSRLTSRSVLMASASWIVERNLLVANMLPFEADGSPSRRSSLPLVEYRWDPATRSVEVTKTTLGQAEAEARRAAGEATLFDALAAPEPVWSGSARELRRAPIPAPPAAGATRNGRRR